MASSLLELWRTTESLIEEKSFRQIIQFSGDGSLRDGNDTSQELRDLSTSDHNLNRCNETVYKQRYKIRRDAFTRFILGYPPRKRSDTAIGDAINWEWIVACATPDKRDVVIVSRDSDYGVTIGKESYVNDWHSPSFERA